MVVVAELTGGHAFEHLVVLDVRRRDDGGSRMCCGENGILECRKAWLVDVFDHLYDCDRVVLGKPSISVGQGSLLQINTSTLARWHLIEAQSAGCHLQGTP